MKVEIGLETLDAITLAGLKEALEMTRRARKMAVMQSDKDYDDKVIAALRVVIDYYSPPSQRKSRKD